MPMTPSISAGRTALRTPGSLLVDLLVVAAVVSIGGGLIAYAGQFSAPFTQKTTIDLTWRALPLYTFFSLCRGVAAYAVSLVFTLLFATAAARSARAERIMLPILDVLQSIPVLGFLPGLVLGMVALFPTREIGLEIACIIMIFTAQAWNMTFSYYASLKGIPAPLREAAAVNRLSRWRTFRLLELPASMIGLVWNSMMSMAGGWFFLTVNEAFRLGDKDFRLPGIGSYMAEAINAGDVPAMLAAVASMTAMIVAVDQLFWRPVVVWSERFKLEETVEARVSRSWFLDVLRRSRLARWIGAVRRARRDTIHTARRTLQSAMIGSETSRTTTTNQPVRWRFVLAPLIAAGLGLLLWGGWSVTALLLTLPIRDPVSHEDWMHVALAVGATFLRTTAALIMGGAWALPVGMLIGLSPKWSQRLQPVIQVVASFPAPMVFPLVVLAITAAHVPFTVGCVALMLLGTQWYILFNVIAGAMSIPADLKEVGRVSGTSRRRMWTRLYLPCVFPYLITGLVTAAGGAWNASIVSEYVQVKDHTYMAFGLGSIINQATSEGRFPLLVASVLAMACSVVLLNRVVWKRLFRLAERRYILSA
jgi:NitT/TauT family transport system permease protein